MADIEEKKYKFDVNNDLNIMKTDEFFWILNKSGLTQKKLAENAVELLGRSRPFSKQAISSWRLKSKNGMKGYQIWLLYYSMNSDIFFKYRRMYYDAFVKVKGYSPYKDFE